MILNFDTELIYCVQGDPPKSHGAPWGHLRPQEQTIHALAYKLFILLLIDSQEKLGQIINLSYLEKGPKKPGSLYIGILSIHYITLNF